MGTTGGRCVCLLDWFTGDATFAEFTAYRIHRRVDAPAGAAFEGDDALFAFLAAGVARRPALLLGKFVDVRRICHVRWAVVNHNAGEPPAERGDVLRALGGLRQPMYSSSSSSAIRPRARGAPHSLNGGGKNFHTSNGNGGAPGWVRGVMWSEGRGADRVGGRTRPIVTPEANGNVWSNSFIRTVVSDPCDATTWTYPRIRGTPERLHDDVDVQGDIDKKLPSWN